MQIKSGGPVMPIEFDITLTSKDMYRFNMYQTYSGFHGWFSIIVAICAFIVAGVTYGKVELTYTIIYIVFGIVFLLYLPVTLYVRSGHSLAASRILGKPLHYAVDGEGIGVSQGEESAKLPWEQIYKMVATKHNVLIYSNRINAYVIPREQLGDRYADLAGLAASKLEKYRVKMQQDGSR